MPLSPGTRIGSYEVTAILGAGGMGEVYRAHDSRLKRDVALKVLAQAFASDPERIARFEREAHTLATLNHPHIAHVYGFERTDAMHVLVMELVDGDDLSHIVARGPMSLDQTLPIATQIADALEAAHDAGIIHRDLKPANIKVRGDGTVKVLDFGLAKNADSAALHRGDVTQSPTITSPAMTAAGMILGTAAYMSPEQAKGRPADKRSDIWAFGCILYEMLSGTRAFAAEDVSDTLANVLKSEPDWSRLPAGTPAPIERLIRRCLMKDRRQRLADIADARFELDDSAEPAVGTPSPASRSKNILGRLAPWALAAITTTIALILWARSAQAPSSTNRTVRFSIAPPERHQIELRVSGSGGANNLPIAMSPDGEHIVMVAYDADGRSSLWVRALEAIAARALPGTDDAVSPFWSPDSRLVGFYSAGKLKKIDINSGQLTTLCPLPTFNAASWSPEGVIVIARAGGTGQGGALLKVDDSGGMPVAATELRGDEELHLRPSFLPDGRHFLYRANASSGEVSGQMLIGSIDSFEREAIPELASAGNVVYASGHLLFMNEVTLMALPFDVNSRRPTAKPFPIADGVQTSQTAFPIGVFSASRTGTLIYQASGNDFGSQLAWFDRHGAPVNTIGTRANYGDIEISPDGKQAAVSVSDPERTTRDIWIVDLATGGRRQVTSDPQTEQSSIWSPDGTRLIYNGVRKDQWGLYERQLTTNQPDEVLIVDSAPKTPWSWTADGKSILFSSGNPLADLYLLPLGNERKPQPFVRTGGADLQARFSPDGRWVSYVSIGPSGPEVFVVPYPGPGPTVQVSSDGGADPRWRKDGKELYFLRGRTVMAAEVSSGAAFRVDKVTPLFEAPFIGSPRNNYDVAPDGQRFLINTPGPSGNSPPIVVVLNWMAANRPTGH